MAINGYLAKSSAVAALGGLLFGFDTVVLSGANAALKQQYALSDAALGATVSAALVGTVLGAMFGGIPGDRYGRRNSLRITAVLYVLSALGCAFAFGWYFFPPGAIHRRSWRSAPLRCSARCTLRRSRRRDARPSGRFLPIQYRLRNPAGVLSNYVVGHHGIRKRRSGAGNWEIAAGSGAALLPGCCSPFRKAPAGSPRRAASRKHESVLRATGDPNYRRVCSQILDSIDRACPPARRSRSSHVSTGLPIFLAVSIGMFNQLSGINAILYYFPDIFAGAGSIRCRRIYSRLQSALPT